MSVSAPLFFDLAVEALDSAHYRLTVTSAPAGPATLVIDAPFTLGYLAEAGDVLDGRTDLSPAQLEIAQRDFGEKLFNAVFIGTILDSYTVSRGHGPLHVRLRISRAGLLANLPWEMLRDPINGPLSVEVLDAPISPRSVGGLHEVIAGPRLVLIPALILVIGVAVWGIIQRLNVPSGDVDLTIVSLHLLPPQPAPGAVVTIAINIQNIGTTPSDMFNWAWFEADPHTEDKPDIGGNVPGLAPGAIVTVKGDFIFGLWGEYDTVAWVDADDKAHDSNVFNNMSKPDTGHVLVSGSAPFVVDFNRLPDNTLLSTSQDLRGNEFQRWGITLSADGSGTPGCDKAIVKLSVLPNTNQLITGLPSTGLSGVSVAGKSPACDTLPVIFTLSHPIGGATLDFTASTGGSYVLELLNDGGQPQGTANVNVVTQTGAQTLKIPTGTLPTLSVMAGGTQLVFHSTGPVAIQKLTLIQALPPSPGS